MADSRVKNMMIATWGKENYDLTDTRRAYYPLKQDESGAWVPDRTQELMRTNNYIFYPIFYDMDTMLGLDNTGHNMFPYYSEDTTPTIFNGEEILWNFVRDALSKEIPLYYNTLESKMFNAATMLTYFSENQSNLANEAFYNGDAKYKYIEPFRSGYVDNSKKPEDEGYYIAPGTAKYLYAAQGSREIMRDYFLTNRIKYLRGKYQSSDFLLQDRIQCRYNTPTATTGELGMSVQYVPANGQFDFTALKTGFTGAILGKNGSIVTKRVEAGEPVSMLLTGADLANGTEAYILGVSNLSDLGDLSSKYIQNFIFYASDVRLKHLTLGNPHRYYNNTYLADGDI